MRLWAFGQLSRRIRILFCNKRINSQCLHRSQILCIFLLSFKVFNRHFYTFPIIIFCVVISESEQKENMKTRFTTVDIITVLDELQPVSVVKSNSMIVHRLWGGWGVDLHFQLWPWCLTAMKIFCLKRTTQMRFKWQ